MNGLGLPSPQPSVRELKEQLAMATALEPISRELLDAKDAYRAALDGGDQAEIAAAKERKQAAANHINETRTWLRREVRIARLTARLAMPESASTPEVWRYDWQKELDRLLVEAAPLRELFAAVGPPVVVEDGTVHADAPTVAVKTKTMKGGK